MRVTDADRVEFVEVRRFVGGLLAGLTHERVTAEPLPVGFRCDSPCGGSPYEIVEVCPVSESRE